MKCRGWQQTILLVAYHCCWYIFLALPFAFVFKQINFLSLLIGYKSIFRLLFYLLWYISITCLCIMPCIICIPSLPLFNWQLILTNYSAIRFYALRSANWNICLLITWMVEWATRFVVENELRVRIMYCNAIQYQMKYYGSNTPCINDVMMTLRYLIRIFACLTLLHHDHETR